MAITTEFSECGMLSGGDRHSVVPQNIKMRMKVFNSGKQLSYLLFSVQCYL